MQRFIYNTKTHKYLFFQPSNLFKLHIYDLHVGFSYEISIRAQSGDFEAESTNKTVEFSIPSCIETFKNLTVCGKFIRFKIFSNFSSFIIVKNSFRQVLTNITSNSTIIPFPQEF